MSVRSHPKNSCAVQTYPGVSKGGNQAGDNEGQAGVLATQAVMYFMVIYY